VQDVKLVEQIQTIETNLDGEVKRKKKNRRKKNRKKKCICKCHYAFLENDRFMLGKTTCSNCCLATATAAV